MGTQIAFDYDRWRIEFPELAGIDEKTLYSVDSSGLPFGYWPNATMILDNNGFSSVDDPARQANILYLLTAHVAYLFSPQTNGVPTTGGAEPPPRLGLVGRISSATEGSVSVQADVSTVPGTAAMKAWLEQTQYGAKAWVLLAPNRTMRYVPNMRRRVYNPPVFRGGYWW